MKARVVRQGNDFFVRETLLEATYFSFDDLKDAIARANQMYDVRVDTYSEYDSAGLEISACRIATEKEIAEFLAEEAAAKARHDAIDRERYEQLKAKFDPNGGSK